MGRLRNQSIRQFLFPLDAELGQLLDGLLSGFPDLLGLLLPLFRFFGFLALRGLVVLGRVLDGL